MPKMDPIEILKFLTVIGHFEEKGSLFYLLKNYQRYIKRISYEISQRISRK